MNGKFLPLSVPSPFVLRLSKDERRVFQQNQKSSLSPFPRFSAPEAGTGSSACYAPNSCRTTRLGRFDGSQQFGHEWTQILDAI